MTLAQWSKNKENQPYTNMMIERLNEMKKVVQKAYRTEDGGIADTNFIELFRIMLNPTMYNPAQQYMFYIKKEGLGPGKYCEYGKISTIKNRILDGNGDLTVYVFLGLKIQFREGSIDKRTWNSIYNNYILKVVRYMQRMPVIEENIVQKSDAEEISTPVIPEI